MPALGRSYLGTNQVLFSNQWLSSANGQFHVLLTDQGELQILWGDPAADNTFVLWSRNAGHTTGNYALIAQGDGNVCIYPVVNGEPVMTDCLWAAHDTALPGDDYCAVIQNDGDFAAYRGADPAHKSDQVWSAKCTLTLAAGNLFVRSQAGTLNQPPTTLVLSSQTPSDFRGRNGYEPAPVSVRAKDSFERAHRWQKWEWRQDGELVAFTLINEKSNLALCDPENKDASVWTTDRKAECLWWYISGRGGADELVLTPRVHESVALNVAGDAPYRDGGKVLVWRWGPGGWQNNVNSLWVFE